MHGQPMVNICGIGDITDLPNSVASQPVNANTIACDSPSIIPPKADARAQLMA